MHDISCSNDYILRVRLRNWETHLGMNSATRRNTGTTHSVRRFINDLDPLTLCTDPSTEMAIPLAILPGAGSETVDVPQEVSWRGLVETALAPLVSSSHLRGTDRDTSSVTA